MKLELTDAEVKQAIIDYLADRVEIPVDESTIKIEKHYLDGSGGFEADVYLPTEVKQP